MDWNRKKLFLFDIDGTLAVGDTLLDGTRELLEHIEAIGGKAYYITNNSTRSQTDYVRRFAQVFGLETVPGQFVTASYTAVRALRARVENRPFYVQGTVSFVDELHAFGLDARTVPPSDPACILVGYDSELSYKKLCVTAELLQTSDAPFYATNPDLRCPAPFGFIPDCGAICRMLTDTTGREPVYFGKPAPEMVQICLEDSGFAPEETLVVGDRLYTDIACGLAAGVDTCLLLTGEAREADLAGTPYPPDAVCANPRALLEKLTVL